MIGLQYNIAFLLWIWVLSLCDANNEEIYRLKADDQTIFSGGKLRLHWETALPEKHIVQCTWKYSGNNQGWNDFLGFDNVNKQRLNITAFGQGWEFTNPSHPCLGGVMIQSVNSSYAGVYKMAVKIQGRSPYESPIVKSSITLCSEPNYYDILENPQLILNDDTELLMYSCGDELRILKCNYNMSEWIGQSEICNSDNFRVTITVLAIFLALVAAGLIFVILWQYRDKLRCPGCKTFTRNNDDLLESGTELESLVDLQFEEVFGQNTDIMVFEENEPIILSVTLSRKAKVSWFRGENLLKGNTIKHAVNGLQRTLTIKKATASMSGVYKCVAEAKTKSKCTTVSHKKGIIVISDQKIKPIFVEDPLSDLKVKAGTTYEYSMKIYGIPVPEIKCFRGDTVLTAEGQISVQTSDKNKWTDVTLLIKDVTLEDGCDLLLRASNGSGELPHALKLNVHCGPYFPSSIQFSSKEDKSVMFYVIVKASPKPTMEWTINEETCSDGMDITEQDVNSYKATLVVSERQNTMKVKAIARNEHGENSQNIIAERPVFYRELPFETKINCGEDKLWTINVKGTPTPLLSYYKNNQEVKDGDRVEVTREQNGDKLTLKIKLRESSLDDCGQIIVKAENALGKVFTETKLIVIGTKPYFKTGPKNIYTVQGSKGEFYVEVDGDPKPKITWELGTDFKDGIDQGKIDSNNRHWFTIPRADVRHTGQYFVKATNSVDTVSASFIVCVQANKQLIAKKTIEDQEILEGSDATFTAEFEGLPEFRFGWLIHGNTIPNEGSDKYVVHYHKDDFLKHSIKLTIKECTVIYSGNIKLELFGDFGFMGGILSSTSSYNANLVVKCSPRFTRPPVDLCLSKINREVKSSVAVIACPEPTVTWFHHESISHFSCTSKFHLDKIYESTSNVFLKLPGSYTVYAENELGVAEKEFTITSLLL